ncbi:alpha/beta hydrolase family protein [Erwinia piriflorinigrans]|uniref:Dienelactone hydrolase n=1 Tax=Erwinia piriflorinigrans CFBP 5888 TaxID=1161919 RepID=V5Z8V7_9GAMM|nr:hypothetical protein [Erwinia piriflorinigrans]CCG87797.1 hypothetical protein EPIR_2434 [Erwinia piriflorinigrans CFBP 5888]
MRHLFALILLLIALPGWGYSVGSQQLILQDNPQQRKLKVRLFYPSSSEARPHREGDNHVFEGFNALADAPVAQGKFPLILLSHGSGGNNTSLAWLAVPLAASGAIVIAANHPGSTTGDSRPDTRITLQTRDLSFLLTHFLQDEKWRKAIDPRTVGAIGHSKGGYSVLALAGGQITKQRLVNYCRMMPQMPDCTFYRRGHLPPEKWDAADLAGDFTDPRVSFVVAIDPGMSYAFTPVSLRGIHIPVLTIAAGYYIHDQPPINLGVNRLPLPRLSLPQAGHFDFLPLCQPDAEKILAQEGEAFICQTPRSQREAIHQQTVAAIRRFIWHNSMAATPPGH